MPDHPTPHWSGPVSRRTPTGALRASRCVSCRQPLTAEALRRGKCWCWPCKDPEGVILRSQQARGEAAERWAARYPLHEAIQGELFA
jgi:hypothetical protein